MKSETSLSFTRAQTETRVLSYAPSPWVLRQCLESDFVFLENPPGYIALSEELAWEKTFFAEADARQINEPVLYSVSRVTKYLRRSVLKRNKMRSLVLPLIVGGAGRQVNLLDIGCGLGRMLGDLIARLPANVQERCVPHGIEISAKLASIANDEMANVGGECVHTDAVNGLLRFSPEYFDVIILSSFLEHEHQPLTLLRNCFAKLRTGGSVVIKVPNYASINRVIRGSKWCGFRHPDHVNYFTPATLKATSRAAGFDNVRIRYRDRQPLSDSMYAVLGKP